MLSRSKKMLQMVQDKTAVVDDNEDSSEPPSLPDEIDKALQAIFDDSDDSVRDPDFVPEPSSSKTNQNVQFLLNESSKESVDGIPSNVTTHNTGNTPNEEEQNVKKRAKKNKGDTRLRREERKMNRNTGKAYQTLKGKFVREKCLRPLKLCRKRCINMVTDAQRQAIFDAFWSMNNYNRRLQYISDLIEVKDKKTTRIRENVGHRRFRQNTVEYHLHVNGANVSICKSCFVKTFDISNKFIETVTNKKRATASGIVLLDQRGNHSNVKEISKQDIVTARNHILSIPSYESHYSRRQSSKRYLPSHYTLAALYGAYRIQYPEKPINRKRYEKIFHELNISIKKPKKDTCSTCDKLAMQIKMTENKTLLENELAAHHLAADLGYTSKARDKDLSTNGPERKTITFDLQQCLPTPDVKNSVAFYKRQLWTFDLTVHDCDNSQAYCYLWHEAIAKRGGNEIGSCLYYYITKDLDKNVKHLIMYSDCCGGQNKNSHISVMCMAALQDCQNLEIIDHKFLISGHTHMECDTDHSMIEKQKKKYNGQIEHPHDWAQLIRQVGKKKPFIVKELETQNFLNFSGVLNNTLINRKVDSTGNKINWREFRWLRYEKGKRTVQYKTTFEESESFRQVNFERRGQSNSLIKPAPAYSGPVPISTEKKQHIIELLPFISESLRDFYRNLKTDQEVADEFSDSDEDEV